MQIYIYTLHIWLNACRPSKWRTDKLIEIRHRDDNTIRFAVHYSFIYPYICIYIERHLIERARVRWRFASNRNAKAILRMREWTNMCNLFQLGAIRFMACARYSVIDNCCANVWQCVAWFNSTCILDKRNILEKQIHDRDIHDFHCFFLNKMYIKYYCRLVFILL